MPIESGLLEILACPACHAPLEEPGTAVQEGAVQEGTAPEDEARQDSEPRESELRCTGEDCGLIYPIRDGIPVLLVDEARRPA